MLRKKLSPRSNVESISPRGPKILKEAGAIAKAQVRRLRQRLAKRAHRSLLIRF